MGFVAQLTNLVRVILFQFTDLVYMQNLLVHWRQVVSYGRYNRFVFSISPIKILGALLGEYLSCCEPPRGKYAGH